jgi:hypothetical protein
MPSKVIRAVVKARLDNAVETRNVFNWGADGGEYSEALGTAIAAKLGVMYDEVRDVTSWRWVGYAVELLHQVEGHWVPLAEISWNHTGNSTVDFNSFQSAVLLIAKTGTFRAIAKKYLAGITDTNVVTGSVIPGAISAYMRFCSAWLLPIVVEGVSWYPGIVSKNSAFAVLTSALVGSILSTWRKRKPGYGI